MTQSPTKYWKEDSLWTCSDQDANSKYVLKNSDSEKEYDPMMRFHMQEEQEDKSEDSFVLI